MLTLLNSEGKEYQLKEGDKIIFDYREHCISFSATDNIEFQKLHFKAGDNKLFFPLLTKHDGISLASLIAILFGFNGVSLEEKRPHKEIFVIH